MLSVIKMLKTTALLSIVTTAKSVTSWDTTPKSNNSSTLIKRLTSWDTAQNYNSSTIKRLTQTVNRFVGENFENKLRKFVKSNIKFHTNFEDDKRTQNMLVNTHNKYFDYYIPNFHPQNTFKCPPCVCKNISSNSVSVICEDCSFISISQTWSIQINEIKISNCESLKALDLQTLLMYTSLTRVEISDANLVKVFSSSCLNVSSSIIDLDLNYNYISKVEDYSFVIFSKLNKLILTANNLKKITKEMFAGLRSLRHLSVALNNIKFIANDTFDDMGNLVSLDISENAIIYTDYDLLPVRIFIPLNNLEELYIHRVCKRYTYQCGSYPNKALQVLTNLKLLSIDAADCRGLGPEIKSLVHLRNLIINEPISGYVCDESYFDNVPSITTLEVYISQPHIPPKAFEKLTNLVNLTYEHFSANDDICKYLLDIEYLMNSSLKYLTFRNLNDPKTGCKLLLSDHASYLNKLNLVELDLSGNFLEYLTQEFIELLPKTLKKIDLSRNRLPHSSLFHRLEYFPNELLEIVLDNQYNRYHDHKNEENINKRFISESKLQTNKIEKSSLNTKVYGLKTDPVQMIEVSKCFLPPKLQILRADNFKKIGKIWLKDVNTSFCSLRTLSLAGGEINDWSFWLLFKTLEIADFSNNNAKMTPYMPYNITLKYLSMSNNLFGHFFENDKENLYFANMKQLIALDISRNSISVIAKDYFKNLTKLQILDTSNNKLKIIDISFSHMTELKFLDFSSNFIISISKQSRDDLDLIAADHRVYLDLTSNPLPCTCEGLELMKLMDFTNVYLLKQDFLVCRNEFHEVLEIGNLRQRVETLQSQCTPKTVIILTCIFSIVGFAILLIASLMYRYRWKLRYLRSIAFFKLIGTRPGANNMVGYRFDAYILYTDNTRRFVLRDCVRELEEKRGHRQCIEDRDFLPGTYNVSNIVSGVQNSAKTVAMVTSEFYEGEYSEYSIKMALMEEIFMRRSVLFLCVCEPTDDEDLSHDLLTAMKQNNYIEYPPRDDVTDEIIEEFWNQFSLAIGRNEHEEI